MDNPTADVVITVLNEGRNIRKLLESLVSQKCSCGIIVVDAGSTDGTTEILKEFESRGIKYVSRKCTRGEGRNIGVSLSSAEFILFTDGDAVPDYKWACGMINALNDHDIAWGRTETIGDGKFSEMKRVPLYYKGFEATYPSMNMGIRRSVFNERGGFDVKLITAEDIDLNIRVLGAGAKGSYCPDCIVMHNTRENLKSFARQAFWNGYGRAQLKRKHKEIWNEFRKDYIKPEEISLAWIARAFTAILGYISFIIFPVRHHPD
jgi:glycosyltransferase involved in cell wall biosynthesis